MISIVIVNFNGSKYIKPCLDSVSNQISRDSELIVVDNGSKDGSVDFIRENYPNLKLIVNGENLGAAFARNQGIKASGREWILTLDCDIVLEKNFIKEITGFVSNVHESISMIQTKILDEKGEKIFSCGIRPSWLKRFYDIGRNLADGEKFNVPKNIFGACSAAALYRRQMLDELEDRYGYFDQRFFFLFEDVDLSWRAKKAGWECVYLPKAVCFHSGDSSSTSRLTRQFLSFRNRNLTIFKNQNPLITLFFSPFYFIYDLPRFLYLAAKFKCRFPRLYRV